VVPAIFDEAERRDPNHTRAWVALVDGANHQIDRIRAEAKTRGVEVSIICDFIHVLEYVWKAAWCFYPEADPAAEAWVRHQALAVLDGKATQVAGVIRRKATTAGLDRARRKSADEAASYLTQEGPLSRLPDRSQQRLADSHRRDRGGLPPHRGRPARHNRGPLGTRRRRSDPQTQGATQQQRLPRLLAVPPGPRTPPSPRVPIRQ